MDIPLPDGSMVTLKCRRAHIPGIVGSHTIITPECHENHGSYVTWQEAVSRAAKEYMATVHGWQDSETKPTYHLILSVETPPRP